MREFVAIIALVIIAAGVGGYILSNQRLYLPGWVPIFGKDFFTLKAEFTTAQAVTPGQGQTVDIAGVKVGEVQSVELKNGRALVTMKIKPKYATGEHPIYHNAQILLRPKTGLKDMILELTPGSANTGKLKSGDTIPVQNTLPDINPDEVLASLDTDTRDYLKLLLQGAGEGLKGDNGLKLSAAFHRFDPISRDLLKITELLAKRRHNQARVIHNFQLLSTELSTKDAQISGFVTNSNAVFKAFANQDARLREALSLLPDTLNPARTNLAKADTFAAVAGPTFQSLRPTARALGPTLRQVRPALIKTTPIIRDQIRPFARDALPTVKALRPAVTDLAAVTPDITRTAKVVNYVFNELAYNPPGDKQEGYLFWASWANHDANSIFSTQDAH